MTDPLVLLPLIGLCIAAAAVYEFRRQNARDGRLLAALGAGTLLLGAGALMG
jgi:hypothetical protein